MRVTQSMYYDGQKLDKNNVKNELLTTNKQLSSGQKIQYAYQSPTTFVNTMRLDDEINTFDQVKKSVNSGQKFSQQTDTTIGEFTRTLDQLKTKLIQAASAANSPASMDALAGEMRGLESHLRNLANTSVNGQYLFSGSLVDTKPIDVKGKYHGNDEEMTSFLGSNVRQPYNITGKELFLGDESQRKRKITTNVQHLNLAELYPDIMIDPLRQRSSAQEKYITPNDTIRELMGDTDDKPEPTISQNHFYISGTTHSGDVFKTVIDMRDDETVDDLLTNIGKAYGNTSTNKVVNVSLNDFGQIEIQDNLEGSSKLDFHMVGNVDPNGAAKSIDELNSDGTNVVEFTRSEITDYTSTVGQQRDQFNTDNFTLNMDLRDKTGKLSTTSTPLRQIFRSDIDSITLGGTRGDGSSLINLVDGNPVPVKFKITDTTTVGDLIKEIKNNYAPDDMVISISSGRIHFSTESGKDNIDIKLTANDALGAPLEALTANAGISYDGCKFNKKGTHLTSNVPQVSKIDNAYATPQTKLSEVSGVYPFVDDASGTTQQLKLTGVDIKGKPYNAQIDLTEKGSTFSLNGGVTNYTIFNMDVPRKAVNGNDMTYKQLTDVINMIVSDTLPATVNSAADYDKSVEDAEGKSVTKLDEKGRIDFEQNNALETKADISLYDAKAFSLNTKNSGLIFNSNSSLTITDPKTDFFEQVDDIIRSVEENKLAADAKTGDLRNAGIQNSIQMLDDLNDHMSREQAKSGVNSQSLQAALDRTEMLNNSAKSMRSDVIDTDVADAAMKLNQLKMNNEAIYSSLGKVSKLSLVNYL